MSKKFVYLLGIKLADYVPGDVMLEPCAMCCWARPPEIDGYNARCTKNQYDLHVGIVKCSGKNGTGFQRQYEFEEILTV